MAVIFLIRIITCLVISFINCSPQFDGKLPPKQKEFYSNLPSFKNAKFINKNELKVSPLITFSEFLEGFGDLFSKDSYALATLPKSIVNIMK